MDAKVVEAVKHALATSAMGNTRKDRAESAINSLQAQGYTIQPVEPTEEMVEAGERITMGYKETPVNDPYPNRFDGIADVYRAMLSAGGESK